LKKIEEVCSAKSTMMRLVLWIVAAIGLSQIVDVNGKKEETFIVSFPKVRQTFLLMMLQTLLTQRPLKYS
jgi:hypothetical protein